MPNISQGSVMTRLRCRGICSDDCLLLRLVELTVWKSISVCVKLWSGAWRYRSNSHGAVLQSGRPCNIWPTAYPLFPRPAAVGSEIWGWDRPTLRTTFLHEREPSLESMVSTTRLWLPGTVFRLNYMPSPTLTHSKKQQLSSCWDGRSFDHNRRGPRSGGGCCAPFRGGEPGPHLTQCGLGRGLPPRQVAFWSIQYTNVTDRQDRTTVP